MSMSNLAGVLMYTDYDLPAKTVTVGFPSYRHQDLLLADSMYKEFISRIITEGMSIGEYEMLALAQRLHHFAQTGEQALWVGRPLK
jgi:hypothetical protein